MSSAYRDDLGAAGERLAQLEASHVERELQRLRELRAMTAAAQSPPPPTIGERIAPSGVLLLAAPWLALLVGALTGALRYLAFGALLLGVGYAAVVFFRGSPLYCRWRHRRGQRKELAKIDAEIATIENAARRIEVSALEDIRVRIAELEAEASLADGADDAPREEMIDAVGKR